MINLKEFKEKLKRTLEGSRFRISLDLLNWELLFEYGCDKIDWHVESAWVYISLGPIQLHLAVGHWGGI